MASWVGMRATATPAQLDAVARAIRQTPIIDHHAHPLLKPDALAKHPLLALTTEATGDAIHSATTSLPHLRAVRQLASVLGCGLSWEAVVAAIEDRRLQNPDDWTATCLSGIETILVDDGLDGDDAQPYSWHDDFTRSRCKRIVRVEAVAEEIIRRLARKLGDDGDSGTNAPAPVFDMFVEEFETMVKTALDDPDVVAFKSVVCYRTGLGIPLAPDNDAARTALDYIVLSTSASGLELQKLRDDALNNFIVHRVASLIRDSPSKQKKPLQFHTGLGDNDLSMTSASPSHLQTFIRAYPTVPIVLLHAGYPFVRETGYLATVYENVYADIGEVFPCVSQDGQERILREILELCPWSKILWSTDGHWFPETYLLAVMQMREVFETVLCDYVRKGHIGWRAAVDLVRDVLFKNANKLYHLDLDFSELQEDVTGVLPGACQTDADLLRTFLKDQPTPDFVRICWTDYTATPRMRMVPFRKFVTLLNEGKPTDIGITKATLGMLQNDLLVPGASATGEYRLHPDFSSLKVGPIDGHISMQGEFREESGARVALCPRSILQRAIEYAAEHGLSLLIGFEVEFLLLERTPDAQHQYTPLATDGHAWSVSRYFSHPRLATLLRDMVATLASMSIHVEQLHAESCPAQFELILPPLPPLEAVDTLLHTRDVLHALATQAGYKLTLHPKPFPRACGTASHMHLSIQSPDGENPNVYGAFYAGVLKRLRAICAFTYPTPASYERVRDGCWAGGRWVAWGTQNRETPLRKIRGSHWEMKCIDGTANPFFAVAAVIFAGARGVADRGRLEGVWGDCEMDPAVMSENDRAEMGVKEMLPASVDEALRALRGNKELVEMLGEEVVERYVAVKKAEEGLLGRMSEEERRAWLIERY